MRSDRFPPEIKIQHLAVVVVQHRAFPFFGHTVDCAGLDELSGFNDEEINDRELPADGFDLLNRFALPHLVHLGIFFEPQVQ